MTAAAVPSPRGRSERLEQLGGRIDALPTPALLGGAAAVGVALLALFALVHVLASPPGGLGGVTVDVDFEDPDTFAAPAADGRDWVLDGSWQAGDGVASSGATTALWAPAAAVVDVGSADVLVTVEAGQIVDGWALTVRYGGPDDLIAVVGAPSFGGYRVVAVEGGVERTLGQVSLASTAPGTELTVIASGDVLVVLPDRQLRPPIPLPETPRGTSVGLYATAGMQPTATWGRFFAQSLGGLEGGGVTPLGR